MLPGLKCQANQQHVPEVSPIAEYRSGSEWNLVTCAEWKSEFCIVNTGKSC